LIYIEFISVSIKEQYDGRFIVYDIENMSELQSLICIIFEHCESKTV